MCLYVINNHIIYYIGMVYIKESIFQENMISGNFNINSFNIYLYVYINIYIEVNYLVAEKLLIKFILSLGTFYF